MQLDKDALAFVIADVVKAATAPLLARIANLEAIAYTPPVVDIDDVAQKAAALVPTPKDGKDGVNGKDGQDGASVESSLVLEMVKMHVADAVAAIPAPRDGKDGTNGRDGVDADPEFIRAEVVKAVAAMPVPKDGTDGADGIPGKDGANGADGVGVSDVVIDRDGKLVMTFTDGRTKAAGVVVGTNGAPGPQGAPGRDGLGFDNLEVEYDGERTAVVKAASGDRVVEIGRMTLPIQIYRGVYKAGETYQRGDTVTWGGSLWHCWETTTQKPGEPLSKAWQLCVKKGSDGKAPPKPPDTGPVRY